MFDIQDIGLFPYVCHTDKIDNNLRFSNSIISFIFHLVTFQSWLISIVHVLCPLVVYHGVRFTIYDSNYDFIAKYKKIVCQWLGFEFP